MAGKLTSTNYDSLVQRLERMADGIALHKAEDGFPKTLDEEKRRGLRQQLEDLRAKYEALAKDAEKAYDEYAALFDTVQKTLAKDDEMVRGFYGKTTPSVADFGTKVISTVRTRKSAPKEVKA